MQNIIALHSPADENCIAMKNSKNLHPNAQF